MKREEKKRWEKKYLIVNNKNLEKIILIKKKINKEVHNKKNKMMRKKRKNRNRNKSKKKIRKNQRKNLNLHRTMKMMTWLMI